ncbi:FAD-dependent oxidoreductase, partial [Chloroflexota bacterium]
MSGTQFKKLFEPVRIGQMQLKNRIAMAPMGTDYAEDDGYVGQRLIDYYEARARGGTGLIIIENTAPDLQCKEPHQLTLGNDSYVPGWQELIGAIHKHGAKIAVQLMHSSMEIIDGEYIQVGPSPVVVRTRLMGVSGKTLHELTTDEIGQIVQWFAAAARRAKEAGVDGVEVHGAHQHLIASFLSSATNIRKDKYGGTVENKARFLIEILQAIRGVVGPDYPVWPRLNAQEYGVENGVTIEETRRVVPMAAGTGAQAIHVSAYGAGSYVMAAPIADTPGFLVPLAEEVKKVTSVPVIAAGRLDPEIGERILEEGKADLIAMGRRLMADPELPNKVTEGRTNEINPCIGCMECTERLIAGQDTACTVNAAMGRESEYRIRLADKTKKVVVAGGGPSGMEAARVAALRGHQVVLFEKEPRLGGQLNVATLPPHKGDISPLINYLTSQVGKAGVEIRLNTEATPELIAESKPDAVVVAIGGNPIIPEIPGTDRANVVTAVDVLSGAAEVGSNVVIIGGGMVGCETGHFLAEKEEKKVTIIRRSERMAADMGPMVRRRLIDGLKSKQVTMLTRTKYEEITEDGVTITTSEGQKQTIKADTVILAAGYKANNDLFKA